MTTKQEISDWFDEGKADGFTHMIVACDTFSHEDYPVYVRSGQEARKRFNELNGPNMQRVMEVYDLSMDKTLQLEYGRAMNLPKE